MANVDKLTQMMGGGQSPKPKPSGGGLAAMMGGGQKPAPKPKGSPKGLKAMMGGGDKAPSPDAGDPKKEEIRQILMQLLKEEFGVNLEELKQKSNDKGDKETEGKEEGDEEQKGSLNLNPEDESDGVEPKEDGEGGGGQYDGKGGGGQYSGKGAGTSPTMMAEAAMGGQRDQAPQRAPWMQKMQQVNPTPQPQMDGQENLARVLSGLLGGRR